MELDKIRKLLKPKIAVPDNTKQEVWQVFADKSQEADTMKINALNSLKQAGLTEQDILGLVMGSQNIQMGAMNPTPQTVKGGLGALENFTMGGMGGILKSLKGMRGGLGRLAGKMGSKMKFPQGYGAPQSPGTYPRTPPFAQKAVNKQINPMQQFQNEEKVRSIIQESIDQLMKPNTVVKEEGIKKTLKGMRKTGIRG